MKMYYYKDPKGNFGDDLNSWLWPMLLPKVFDEDESELFVGIGTLLNDRLPRRPKKHVFGSGVGYGELPFVDSNFIVHAVRGHETARVLGLDSKLVVTDSAVLIRAVNITRSEEVPNRIGFMPTGHSIQNNDWEAVCEKLGFHYISSHWSVEKTLLEMTRCSVLMTEAMHGAIVADALRIPWIPINCYGYVLDFKWKDWLSSLNMTYQPRLITPLYGPPPEADAITDLKHAVKRTLMTCGVWSDRWTPPPHRESSSAIKETAMNELLSASRSPQFLSQDHLIESLTSRYLDLVQRFNNSHVTTI